MFYVFTLNPTSAAIEPHGPRSGQDTTVRAVVFVMERFRVFYRPLATREIDQTRRLVYYTRGFSSRRYGVGGSFFVSAFRARV